LFDLACDPQQIARRWARWRCRGRGCACRDRLDAFEQAVRAVLGQLVSVAMAAKLTAKVAAAFGEPLAEGFFFSDAAAAGAGRSAGAEGAGHAAAGAGADPSGAGGDCGGSADGRTILTRE
jgi:3-methyladenine DNA glycosylase/8-oxoguanine DNA glycosylase